MLRGFVFLSFLATLTAPTAPIRPENDSWIPRVILAQSSRASIFFFTERQCSSGSDYLWASERRHQFEGHSTVLSSWRTPVHDLYHPRGGSHSYNTCSSYSYAFNLTRETRILTIV